MQKIFYCIISRCPNDRTRQFTPLVECALLTGNHKAIALHIMKEKIATATIGSRGLKTSFPRDSYEVHVYVINDVCYLCIADQDVKRSACLAFLESIRESFETMFGIAKIKSASSYEFNHSFRSLLEGSMQKHAQERTKLDQLQQDVEDVHSVMRDNLNKAVARGDKINTLITHSAGLADTAHGFRTASGNLKRKMWWKNVWFIVGMVLIVGVIIFLIIASQVCHWKLFPCGGKSDE
ncbi:Synaptobrevin like protein [Aduncisulcus paluster]|uniref:Synaptobrevin like protein n=1 Tax=Aduncisulcus paluster TaxID=2918883 RepID=A0ABQ5K610_9EUKA|nr:Synaptobrevin like protein [Aduncisulcus paluster]|eukprot:gnl/Carplike_NY0171/1813_a2458_777.p1 GENE.gnl/Carplike_NY0171/1813_a2458_777~~gnl/Carplike_NY0171/1813_a2458_777.p1  ORF type:complete len:246 (-),score=40.11 gnl/Carplike_NY0171/1813_a2458_777:239-949(-)